MKRILINATHNEEIRVALCKDNHLYDFDLENRTREQKKSNIYKGHVTRVEPSLEAVFVEYGSERQGFLPIREIANEYLKGNPREENIRKLIKEGDELIVQIEKEERGNKGAALSTFISLAGRYLVLMPNNPRGGGISRQITGRLREEMKRMLADMDLPKGMSVIVRTAGIGKTQEDLQHDLNHLLNIWNAIQEQNKTYPSPRLVHQEAGVVTRAVRDYLRDDISEIWIDSENAYNEAENFIKAVMPKQVGKLRKYTDYEPMFASFNVEKQIETAYQREVRLPSGGSIVIDQTEALVSIDINSAKSTKGSDVSETAYHTNLEAAEEIARQLRLRDMGGLVVIDFIDMSDSKHQKDVEKRLLDSTKYDRARVQFGNISKFGLMEMSRQRLRPSLEESTGYICPRCHGNGMIRDLRSLSLAIMRQIEEIALKRRHGEVQAEVPTDIAAFLLNEKRESLVYLEQDSGTRITILPHAHMESPDFKLHFNQDGFVPASYERISDTQDAETSERGYAVDWQTNDTERPEQQPTRQPVVAQNNAKNQDTNNSNLSHSAHQKQTHAHTHQASSANPVTTNQQQPSAVAWLANLFAPTEQARTVDSISSQAAANAIEEIVNSGAQSRGVFGDIAAINTNTKSTDQPDTSTSNTQADKTTKKTEQTKDKDNSKRRNQRSKHERNKEDKRKHKGRYNKSNRNRSQDKHQTDNASGDNLSDSPSSSDNTNNNEHKGLPKRRPHSKRDSRGNIERGEALNKDIQQDESTAKKDAHANGAKHNEKEITLHVKEVPNQAKEREVIHFLLNDNGTSHDKNDNNKNSGTDTHRTSDANASTSTTSTSKENKDSTASNAQLNKASAHHSNVNNDVVSDTLAQPAKMTAKNIDNSVVDSDTINNNDNNADDKTLSFNSKELFAERYITANKYGQASNDPRVVRAKQLSNDSTTSDHRADNQTASTPDNVTPKLAITGTVGEFILNTLGEQSDEEKQAQDSNIIVSFLKALSTLEAQHNLPINTNDDAEPTAAPHLSDNKINTKNFDFSNYGYAPLSTSYLDSFHDMTSAVDSFSIKQGKVESTELTVTKRASNDPRGQHPDYQSQADAVIQSKTDDTETQADADSSSVAVETQVATDTITNDSNNDNDIATDDVKQVATSEQATVPFDDYKAFSKLMAGSVGNFVEQILGASGVEMISQGNTEVAFLAALKQPMTDIVERLRASSGISDAELTQASLSDSANALMEEATQDNTSEAHDSAIDKTTAVNDTSGENTKSTANKTSIASYKSMIENISEQLSSQMGLSSLIPIPTKPTASKSNSNKPTAKSRTRKNKTDEGSSNKDE